MSKWIMCNNKMPEEGQEVVLITYGEVIWNDVTSFDNGKYPNENYDCSYIRWLAAYKKGKFLIAILDNEGDENEELNLRPICWMPLPEIPFTNGWVKE